MHVKHTETWKHAETGEICKEMQKHAESNKTCKNMSNVWINVKHGKDTETC